MAGSREYLDATIKEMKEEEDSEKSLMWKAITYFDHCWKRLFAYRNDARYTIDNSLAEGCIRSFTCERKVSMFYGSFMREQKCLMFTIPPWNHVSWHAYQ